MSELPDDRQHIATADSFAIVMTDKLFRTDDTFFQTTLMQQIFNIQGVNDIGIFEEPGNRDAG